MTSASWKTRAKAWRARALAAEAALDFEYGGHVCIAGRPCSHEPAPSRTFAELMAWRGKPDVVPGVSFEIIYGPGPASEVSR